MKKLFLISEIILVIVLIHSCKKVSDENTKDKAIRDGDRNIYTSLLIGTQTWLTKDLKTTKYNDGTIIPQVTNITAWGALATPAFCWYNNDSTIYKDTYGALYNWYVVDAASNGGKNVCPMGWHVPDKTEWTTLITFLGGENSAGGKLKESGTAHWLSPNAGATNESGFVALPAGNRYYDGVYYDIGKNSYWWSSTVSNSVSAWNLSLYYNINKVFIIDDFKRYGFSVRCLKN
jgi:uncharacterized protein (TIGR02145 family)